MKAKRPAEARREERPGGHSQRTGPTRQPRVLSEAELELRWALHMRLVAALAEVRSGDVHDVVRTLLVGCVDLIDAHHEPPAEGRHP